MYCTDSIVGLANTYRIGWQSCHLVLGQGGHARVDRDGSLGEQAGGGLKPVVSHDREDGITRGSLLAGS